MLAIAEAVFVYWAFVHLYKRVHGSFMIEKKD